MAATTPSQEPVLIELFTSEGCSSCPAADERLGALDHAGVAGVPVVVLGMHVDYWDELGWKDTFGSPAWTARQRAYSHSMGRGNVYTPQAVVDGVDEFVGSDVDAARDIVHRAAARPKATVVLSRAEGPAASGELSLAVRVTRLPSVTPGDSVEVLAAISEDHVVDPVTRGENAGKHLALAPVVLSLDAMGPLNAAGSVTRGLRLPQRSAARALRVVAIVQERTSRRVLGVGSEPLSRF